MDGTQLTLSGGSGSMGLIDQPKARFGTHINTHETALILWENLCYLRSYNRGADAEVSIPSNGDPVVNVTNFDGPRPTVIHEVYDNATETPVKVDKEDGTACDDMIDGGFVETLLCPNGREHVALVIRPTQDLATYEDDGTRVDMGGDGDPMPGVAIHLQWDAVGAVRNSARIDKSTPIEIPCWGNGTTTFDIRGNDELYGIAIGLGPKKKKNEDTLPPPSSNPQPHPAPGTGTGGESTGDGQINQAATICLCQESDASLPWTSHVHIDTSLGMFHDHVGGNSFERTTGVSYCSGDDDADGAEDADDEGGGFLDIVGAVARAVAWVATSSVAEKSLVLTTVCGASADDAVSSLNEAVSEEWGTFSGVMTRVYMGEATAEDIAYLTGIAKALGHGALDLVGMMPLPGVSLADAINAAWYAVDGEAMDAIFSAIGAVPLVGDLIRGAWVGVKIALKGAKTAAEASGIIGKFFNHATALAMGKLGKTAHLGGVLEKLAAAWAHVGSILKKFAKGSGDLRSSRRGAVVIPFGRVMRRPADLPAWGKLQPKWGHILGGHAEGGARLTQSACEGGAKTAFEGMSSQSIMRAIRSAYGGPLKKLQTQGDRVLVEGTHEGMRIRMWINKVTKELETAYPVR